jgi:hypothetical protein
LVLTEWSKFNRQSSNTTQRNIEESIEQCKISKNLTLAITLKENSNENVIPNSISTLTHLHTFKLIGIGQEVNVNSITTLHNQIQTCVIESTIDTKFE